jgi:hypothetical protein
MAYTFSRSIDTDSEPFGGGPAEAQGVMEVNNIRLDRGLSAFDATHRLAGTAIWELPFLRGSRSPVGAVLGGWQLNGIISLQSGFPLHGGYVGRLQPRWRVHGPSERGNCDRSSGRRFARKFSDGVFGPQAQWGTLFLPAPNGTTPQLGRNTFRGPGYASVDGSIFKEFAMPGARKDSVKWPSRAEFFNLFHRVNFRGMTNSLGSYTAVTRSWSNVNFGRSTAAFSGRQVQLALKVRF